MRDDPVSSQTNGFRDLLSILVVGCINIFKRMSRTLTEVGPTLRMTLFRDEAAQASR